MSEVLEDINPKPAQYCRYVDDMYLQANDTDHRNIPKAKMDEQSMLKLTTGISTYTHIAFLDINADARGSTEKTNVIP